MEKGILKPQRYDDIQEIWKRKEQDQAKKSGVDPEDQAIYTLATMPGWKSLKEHINNLKSGLDARLAESVIGSSSADQIKTDAIFAVMGKSLLDSIINKVEYTAQVVEEIANGKQESGE